MNGLCVDDLTRLRWAMEPAIDATGQRLAYVVSGPDAERDILGYSVHLVDLRSGETTTVQSAMTRHPRWAPNGSRLAALALVDERWQVARVGDSMKFTVPVTMHGDVVAFDWSPDGERIVGEVVDGGRHRLWCIDLANAGARPLTSLGFGDAVRPAWSPDGERITFIADGRIWSADVGTAADPRRITSSRCEISSVAWAPDGEALAYIGRALSEPWANRELWVIDRWGGERSRLGAALDRSVGQVVRGDDERGVGPPCLAWTQHDTVLAAFADGGSSSIAAFDLDGGWNLVAGGQRAILEFALAAASGALAYTWSDPCTPGEVSVLGTDGSDRRCSDLARPLRDQRVIAPTERVTTVADDGQTVEGWLTSPVGGRETWPLVVQVHGGPHYPVGARFSFDAQRLADHGVAVLRANPRGSQGYGQRFAAGIQGDWGGRDLDDLLALIEATIAHHPIDRDRVAIVGESYGGFLAMAAIATTDRFAAAVAENGVADLDAAEASDTDFWRAELGTDSRFRRDRSPLAAARRMTTPLLMVHAADDTIVPIAQSRALVDALRRFGRTVDLVTVPGEDHFVNVFGRPSRRVDKIRAVDAFLHRHLVDDDGEGAERREESSTGALS